MPSAVEHALAGWQWIEVVDHAHETWLAALLRSLASLGLERQVTLPSLRTLQKPTNGGPLDRACDRSTGQPARATHELCRARARASRRSNAFARVSAADAYRGRWLWEN